MNEPTYKVEIVEKATDKVINQYAPGSLRRCEKIEDGVNINLHHAKFFTRIVECGPADKT